MSADRKQTESEQATPRPMKRCENCGNLFRYPPSDGKDEMTLCAYCDSNNPIHYYCDEGTDEDPTPIHRCRAALKEVE